MNNAQKEEEIVKVEKMNEKEITVKEEEITVSEEVNEKEEETDVKAACTILKQVYDLSFGQAKDAALNQARELGCAWAG